MTDLYNSVIVGRTRSPNILNKEIHFLTGASLLVDMTSFFSEIVHENSQQF